MARRAQKKTRTRSQKVFAGRYAYIKPLGRGAGGSVYLAEDLHVDRRQVALKVLSEEAYKTVQGKMIRREFEILSKLDHPNLVRVYDFGSLPDGGVFLAEEYVDGFSLQDARALLEPEALIDVTFQILLGLSYLHGMGMIHRDIKPANVMLLWLDDASARPMVKLVDFGLSSMDPKRDTLRGGTRSYMAPEIIRGEKGELRSDLYSLGVTLYYALCGVLPFGPRSKQDPPPTEEDFRPPDPHRLNPDVPLALSRFTMALLRQLEDFEYNDAGEALQDLVRDTEHFEEWSGGVLANSLDVSAAPVIRGYFERGILGRRQAEHEEIAEAILDDEPARMGRLHLLTGREGVGKSRLMREIGCTCKLSNRLVVEAGCEPGMRPYELLHALLSRIIEIGESRDIEQIEHYRPYLLILERLSRLESDVATASADHSWIREAFEDAVVMLHPQKVVLLIEDIHYSDQPSADFMLEWFDAAQAFHRPDVIATMTTDTLGSDSIDTAKRSGLAGLLRAKAARVKHLEGVNREDVDIFFKRRLGLQGLDEAWLDRVARHADGQPAYLEELCRTLIDQGVLRRESVAVWSIDLDGLSTVQLPRGLRESFRRRFTAVSAAGRETLELLALGGRDMLWEELRELIVAGGESPEVADRTLKTLHWRHLTKMHLDMRGRHVSLLDDVLAEVVGDLASPQWRRALHRRIGHRLAKLWVDGQAPAAEAAKHLQAGGLDEEASVLFEVAGDQAWFEAEYSNALDALRTALELRAEGPSHAFLNLKLAKSYLALYEPEACRKALRAAGEAAETTALSWLIYAVFVSGARMAIGLDDPQWASDWLARIGDFLPALSRQAELMEIDAELLARAGQLAESDARIDEAIGRARHFGTARGIAGGLTLKADLAHITGDVDRASALYEEALEVARGAELAMVEGKVLYRWGAATRRSGAYERALELLSKSLVVLGEGAYPEVWIDALLQIALAHGALGDTAEARRYACDALVFAKQLGSQFLRALVELAIAELDLVEGSNAEAMYPTIQRNLRRMHEIGSDKRLVAEAWIRQGILLGRMNHPDAPNLLAEGRRIAQKMGAGLLLALGG